MEHPDVDQAYAFGWRLGGGGEESLCCAVVLRTDHDRASPVNERDLSEWMRERISSYKIKARFVLLGPQQVPTTSTGKVSKRLIGERFVS